MATLAPGPTARARAAPPAAWWRYVERGRSHEVRVEWAERAGRLHVLELAAASPEARVEETLVAARPWEARVALWLMEARLAQLGEYWAQRAGLAGWRRVARPAGAPAPDPRRNEVLDAAHAPLVHHYHDAHGGGDRLLAALREDRLSRYVVVTAALDVPDLDIGRIEVLHARLPDVLTRSVVMREQMALTQNGLSKLVTRDDYVRAFGDGGASRAARLVDEVLERVREGRLDRPLERLEDSDAYAEFLVTLQDPRLHALHRRFLRPGEEDALLQGGAVEIRKAVQAKRAQVDHNEQHLLTILEASLLARERMRGGQLRRGDPEVRALARLAYYL